MVFNGTTVIIALFFIAWLVILSILLLRAVSHYNRLTRGISKTGLKDVLENFLKDQEQTKSRTVNLEKTVSEIVIRSKTHVQRIGIVRYNPFSDTGGSQSFSLAILDGKENGIVMTSLYARTGNRWYVKEIRNGRGSELELSKEEETAVKRAQPLNI